jgi:hypothetical protein
MFEPDVSSVETDLVGATDALQPLYLHLSVVDPETVAVLTEAKEGRDRQELALTALKVGVLALRAAQGTVDGATVRNEGDRLLSTMAERLERHRELLESVLGATLKNYFDPSDGAFNERLQRLLRNDGELATVVQTQVQGARASLEELFTIHLGKDSAIHALLSPDEGNAFMEALRAQVTESLQAQERLILAEFSLDRPESALRRLVTEVQSRHGDLERSIAQRVAGVVDEFSLDKEDSALSRLVGRVDTASKQISAQFSLDNPESGLNRLMDQLNRHHETQGERARAFESQVMTMLERLVTRKTEVKRSTVHGTEFEDRVGEQLRGAMLQGGDLVEDVGATTGLVPRSKVGDFVVTLGPDSAAAGATIVVEAKESASYTLRDTIAEADTARRNRGASVSLFVHSAVTAGADIPELQRWGNDVIVRWDADNPDSDVVLRAGLLVAKALCVRAQKHDTADAASFQEIDAAVEAIRKQLQGLDEIQTMASTVQSSGEKIKNRARIMSEEVKRRLQILVSNAARLREASGATDE